MSEQQNLFQNRTVSLVKEFAKIKSEHDLRLKVRDAFFDDYSVDVEDERVDFLVYYERTGFFTETFMWAESKDKPTDVFEMFAQLLLTIKKKVDSGEMPPKYLGVFDKEKIAFTEFYNALDIFNLNDFDWTERPSAASKKTVNQVEKYLKNIVEYRFDSNLAEIVGFIRTNFTLGKVGTTKAQINKNNFVAVYDKWVKEVLPSIDLLDKQWKAMLTVGVGHCDFYLADLLSEDNKTISDKLNVMLQTTYYKTRVKIKIEGEFDILYRDVGFNDGGEAHAKFWTRYERPPKREYHKHIIERRDLLVPKDLRERRGAFFTPAIWVKKSQEYLAQVFGENWQDEYYIWDCCAGTCNLLAGLTNPHRVWSSTLEQPDVDIVHENIKQNEIYLLESHVFQFDFLNDNFDQLPKSLRSIIKDKEKRKKLIIYMNPPYAEHGSTAGKEHKVGVAIAHQTKQWFKDRLGAASRELYAQFLMRIHEELNGCKIALFSKLKHIQANNFKQFRQNFTAKFLNGFLIPANTFDNVTGKFPIAFQIWNTEEQKKYRIITADIYNRDNEYCGKKKIINVDHGAKITKWIKSYQVDARRNSNSEEDKIGRLNGGRTDFQNQNLVFIVHHQHSVADAAGYYWIHRQNLIPTAIYFAVRHCIAADWLNDRDQFFAPNDGYQTDKEFQNDCLIFTLFHHQNRICNSGNSNHWIPFAEKEIDAKDNFQSTFMSDFLQKRKKLSKEAKAVFEAGKALWTYYHDTIKMAKRASVDASLYEIREYFKGRNEKGRMKAKAADERFNELDAELRASLRALAAKIQPKVYKYGFLKK